MENNFKYESSVMGNTVAGSGTIEWDKDRKQWKATITPQREPEIRFEAWDDGGEIAGLLCIAKWLGQDLQNSTVAH